MSRQFRMMASEENTTVQALVGEALDLRRHRARSAGVSLGCRSTGNLRPAPGASTWPHLRRKRARAMARYRKATAALKIPVVNFAATPSVERHFAANPAEDFLAGSVSKPQKCAKPDR
jgi:hypothetical protein